MREEWMQWKPTEGLSTKYYIDSVVDMVSNFKIVLSNAKLEEEKVEIIFCDGVDAYTQVNESFRQKLLHELYKKSDRDSGENGVWTFFKVKNSEYIRWLSEQSYGWSESRDFIHFSFITVDAVLDVITTYEPEIKMIGETKI